MIDLGLYITKTIKGQALTDAFYDASLSEKREVLEELIRQDLIFKDRRLYDLLIKAYLQHSSRKMKKEYPIKGDRKQRPAAREADQYDVLTALHANLDRIAKALYLSNLPEVDGRRYETMMSAATWVTVQAESGGVL